MRVCSIWHITAAVPCTSGIQHSRHSLLTGRKKRAIDARSAHQAATTATATAAATASCQGKLHSYMLTYALLFSEKSCRVHMFACCSIHSQHTVGRHYRPQSLLLYYYCNTSLPIYNGNHIIVLSPLWEMEVTQVGTPYICKGMSLTDDVPVGYVCEG